MTMSNLTFVLFFIFSTLASRAMSRTIHETTIAEKHEQWMSTHGRKYESKLEKEKRFKIFKDNLEYIESFNNGANRSYELGVNEFADMTRDEFVATHTGYKMPLNPTTSISSTSFRYENLSDVPPNLDWREKGAVTPVKNQQSCGCCWAFSAVAAMEGITQIQTGDLISMSEQQLLDCTGSGNSCDGGWMMNAFEYVIQNQGITTEETYPYQPIQGSCESEKATAIAATINNYEMVPANDEQALLQAVTNQPVSVALDGSGQEFMNYKTGVFNGPCGTSMTHAVTIVGYGTTDEGINYWLIKNSWGETWGENGYMKIQRDVGTLGGQCGIAMKASYPIA